MSLPTYLCRKGKRWVKIKNGLIFKSPISKQGSLDTELHPQEELGKTEERNMVLRMAVFLCEAAAPYFCVPGIPNLQSNTDKGSILLRYWCRYKGGRGGGEIIFKHSQRKPKQTVKVLKQLKLTQCQLPSTSEGTDYLLSLLLCQKGIQQQCFPLDPQSRGHSCRSYLEWR